ncbi:hypothetical protein Q1695_002385 [Nippostrongylus brasiliensis]|nr:hypothetical protein Q1695_002385 [Nippostrongylus brasiliensis]
MNDVLPPGAQIEQWFVVEKLGEGSFGAVYKVKDGKRMCALKVENQCAPTQVLKMEVFVLTELENKGSRHFCQIKDKGRFTHYNYVIMTLVGKSLRVLRKKRNPPRFTLGCALSVGIQCLEALEDLHSVGYLHRDIKPDNYTVGRAENNELRTIYLLDFGMCRKYTNDEGVMRKPRSCAGFRGTTRYAPLSCHHEKEMGRKDDIESWLYQQVELTVGQLPWKNLSDIKQIGEYKKKCRQKPGLDELFVRPCPQEYHEILSLVDGCGYYDEPDYEKIYTLLRTALKNCGQPEFPYDWEH